MLSSAPLILRRSFWRADEHPSIHLTNVVHQILPVNLKTAMSHSDLGFVPFVSCGRVIDV